jgi:C_GCAxxG_C_C family probable redox protein
MENIDILVAKAGDRCDYYRLQEYHCSEATIRAVSETLNVDLSDEILKVASGFRGGGGGYKERCGVLEAGIILISYLYGRTRPEEDAFSYSYLIRMLHDRFLKELGSYNCRVLRSFSQCHTDDHSCALTYRNGAMVITRLLLEADQLLKDVPEEEKGVMMLNEPPE